MSIATFSTCEISDALIKLGLPSGGHLSDIQPLVLPNPSTKICGPAYTVQMVLASNESAPRLSAHFVDTAPESTVIVIDAPSHARNAVWGGLMTAGAQARGAVGVVISGRCRDLSEHRTLGFPVFARGHSTLGQSPFTRPSEVNIPLTVTPPGELDDSDAFSVRVNPGDWIIGDEDGVVCVPRDLESQVVDLASKGRVVDEHCMGDIKAGLSIQDTFRKYRGK